MTQAIRIILVDDHTLFRMGLAELLERHGKVSVEDNGIGLKSNQSTGPGMHLGMNIMRERAQRLGGEIHFDNQVGEGMHVRLEFPATIYRKVTAT